ncbi:MAG: hypothetical protein KJ687_11390 [Proteobacteria bacterium]|nr:hypothetical protein [Pseudomonadota bacterium]
MESDDLIGIRKFLTDYPGMSLVPSRGSYWVIKGVFSFSAMPKGKRSIVDSYQIKITVPDEFPRAIPTVTETTRKIPRDGMHHVNPDGSLCMGSPLRLLQKISENPNLAGFSENCLVPYLYGVSYKLQTGEEFPFGELPHGENGILEDYLILFGLKTTNQVKQALKLLGIKERIANKQSCPCACGQRLGKCSFRHNLNQYRKLATRPWFRDHQARMDIGK